ncbi:hypothetical protein [Aquipseudomonas alcaligenes]|uniref:hypothetical protein n=1 Tax=Aquipseudomonas alcaligenes TaxID=43263 RepID=UPI0021AC7E73|nr:hypothetical protein [Pseudomonas alcaligenes]
MEYLVRVVPLLFMLLLSGCYSLSETSIDPELQAGPGEPVSYLVGVVGVWPDAAYSAHEQNIFIRRRGGDALASARLLNKVYARTKRDLRETNRGIGTLFVMPLKPGMYELHNVLFRWRSSSRWAKEDFSIPLPLEAGKAYYIGDFRAACMISRNSCIFLHSSNLQRDQALLWTKHPELPELTPLALEHLESAYPLVIEEDGPQSSIYKAFLSERLK